MSPVVLTFAGSDPSGGAGVQADQRVIEALGCTAVSVITALTSQNSQGVSAIFPVPADVLRSQLDTLLTDITPEAVKIGLLPSTEHIQTVAQAIERYALRNVVLDPVIAPTVGEPFLDQPALDALRRDLLPIVRLVTPNIHEAELLLGEEIDSVYKMESAAANLSNIGPQNVLITGGHLAGDPIDILAGIERARFNGRRVHTDHSHGTGCFLSSAIACGLARGWSVRRSVRFAKRCITEGLNTPVVIGSGRGYPRINPQEIACMSLHADRLSRLRGIYFVTDDRMSDAHQVREVVGAALRSGVRVIQLRDKRLPKAELIALAKQLREDTDAFDALLIINDYVDVAQLSNADGVHLGPDDISPARARELLGENALIGISAGSIEEMEAYGDTSVASYFGCGPVYGSKTKHDAGRAIGVERVALMRDTYPQLPIIAIGGITAENIGPLANLKINGAAVVSTISAAQNPEIAAQELVQLWH